MILAKKLMLGLGNQSKPYVEFVSSTPMTITPKYTNNGVTLQYSLNGTSWKNIISEATTPSANVIYFRGQAIGTKSLFRTNTSSNTWTFTNASNLAIYGKFDRLIQDSLGGDDDILSIGDYCFSAMLGKVSSLIYVDTNCLPATTSANQCYYNMFQGCTSLTTTPSLPATILANYCYSGMFQGCTSLTTTPSLPATILADYCYRYMFQGCTSIKLSTTQTGIYNTSYRIPTTGTGTTAVDSLKDMFTGTGGTFKGTPTINTTYYTENTLV